MGGIKIKINKLCYENWCESFGVKTETENAIQQIFNKLIQKINDKNLSTHPLQKENV